MVKGVNFVDLRDAGDPVEAAIAYDAAGADELCFLDITASHENRGTMLDVVRRTAEACFMPLTVGGGVRTVDDIRALLLAGADKVSINTAAVGRREFVREAARKIRQPVHRRGDRRQAGQAGAANAGKSSPMAGAMPPASTPSHMRQEVVCARRRRNPADLDGSRRHEAGLRLALTRPWPTASRCR